ncbi:uncharacterized protein LOC135144250 isoform X2 [Zophobas morio]|uniref:uncharacterized protein LOC135144250 isoform X2 n=1 Tax=Zophobas morio TaxID=2755281 RepID=UPI0030827828
MLSFQHQLLERKTKKKVKSASASVISETHCSDAGSSSSFDVLAASSFPVRRQRFKDCNVQLDKIDVVMAQHKKTQNFENSLIANDSNDVHIDDVSLDKFGEDEYEIVVENHIRDNITDIINNVNVVNENSGCGSETNNSAEIKQDYEHDDDEITIKYEVIEKYETDETQNFENSLDSNDVHIDDVSLDKVGEDEYEIVVENHIRDNITDIINNPNVVNENSEVGSETNNSAEIKQDYEHDDDEITIKYEVIEKYETDGKKTCNKYPKKRNFCIFCKTLKTNIARHFELVHEDREEVQQFLQLPKQSSTRLGLISALRKKGNFEYNIENTEQPILIRKRHALQPVQNPSEYYLPCSTCFGFFSHQALARHHRKCSVRKNQGTRSIKRNSRMTITKVHHLTNHVLKKKILPPMRRDTIFNTLIKDKLIILYGNYLSSKYTGHQEYRVRNHLRFITKYFTTVKSLCPKILYFSTLFRPTYFDIAIDAILKLLASSDGVYRSPKSALQLVHMLKVCCNVLHCRYIKEDKVEFQKRVKEFLKLLNTEAPTRINKPALKRELENKRKQINLRQTKIPLTEDVTKFKEYLIEEADKFYKSLIFNGFNFDNWKSLAEVLVLYIAVFNRKQSRETHKVLVDDFLSMIKLSNTSLPETYENLSPEEKSLKNDIYKLTLRGKLDSVVTALIPNKVKLYLDYVHDHREDAGVSNDNPYLFGIPGMMSGERFKILETCTLMRKYTKLAHLQHPETIRTTLLRKHLATQVSAMNLEDAKQKTVMDFMDDQEQTHKKYYRQEIVTQDLMLHENLTTKIAVDENKQPGVSHEKSCSSEMSQTLKHVSSTKVTNANLNIINESNNSQPESDLDSSSSYKIASEISNDSEQIRKGNKQRRNRIKASYKRKRMWSTPERQTARRVLGNFIKNHTAPSEEECRNILLQEPCLKNRTPLQLKAWAYNQIKNVYYRKGPQQRKRWTTPEKAIVRNVFSNYINQKTYPSSEECRRVLELNPELQGRTVPQIKSFLQHAATKH